MSDHKDESEMSFLDHLEELRWHIMRGVGSVLFFAILAFLNKKFVFTVIILGPSRLDFPTYQWLCELSNYLNTDALCIHSLPFTIQSRTMTGQFAMHIMSSAVIGLICAFPYTFWEIWRFIKPGLYNNEKSATTGATFFVTLLFATGVLFGYYIVSPLAVNFLSNYQIDESILNEFDVTSYISTIAMIVLSGGVMFQLPMVVYVLSKSDLITPEGMKQYRRHAIVVILIISAIITPPDPVTQVMIAGPIYMLYELSIHICARVIKKNRKEAEKALRKI
ncbi:twin-arginine translocase subunit TatC [Flammeovirga yaeyamensis]|uniref:Sec-independent protein translocase protein TatC n=1 Tax=Flammeovirga yaeyamensis TaxID=367791 RepID=A0AAX1N0I4_9BACT|nr:twin-arginine translocase subunit TatC [Flammeovirga yaeyamensis]MBB3698544.1 sec-independent protein translocase protein TatC [Flammeovirga yaeyamensis]NMF34107.1 twin-arginine translocase subunit TatC [Flammeovirga yaeyamensis]QWG01094.1 twin-arginine translocase subunit TatC [Flammeovirga yaeyamensis]